MIRSITLTVSSQCCCFLNTLAPFYVCHNFSCYHLIYPPIAVAAWKNIYEAVNEIVMKKKKKKKTPSHNHYIRASKCQNILYAILNIFFSRTIHKNLVHSNFVLLYIVHGILYLDNGIAVQIHLNYIKGNNNEAKEKEEENEKKWWPSTYARNIAKLRAVFKVKL